MHAFNYHRATSVEDAAASVSGRRRRRLYLGRPHAAAHHEAAPRRAVGPHRSGGNRRACRHRGRWRGGRDRRAHAPCQRRGVRRGAGRDPGARRARGQDRRPAGAQQGHHRRVHRQQRPGGGLSGGSGRARRHRRHERAHHRGGRLLHRAVRDGAGGGRDRHRRAFSPGPRRRVTRSSRTRRRAMPSSA